MERAEALDDELIDAIYEAGAVPEKWPGVLERLAARIEAQAGALMMLDRHGTVTAAITRRYDDSFSDFYESKAVYDSVRPQRALDQHYAGFVADNELCTQDELAHDAIYRRFLNPYGLGRTSGMVVVTPDGEQLVFDIARAASADAFSRAEMQRLDPYRPHLARAALLSVRVGRDEALSHTMLMSSLGVAAAALSDIGRVLSANALFEELAPRIAIRAYDRVAIADADAAALLDDALGQLGADVPMSPGSFPVKASGRQPPMIVHLVPMRRAARDLVGGTAVLMLVTPVSARQLTLTDLLDGLFDLTPAEARVARAITNGATLADLSAVGAVSVETLRSQLKSAMNKTGTRRQVDLVRLMLSARPLGGTECE